MSDAIQSNVDAFYLSHGPCCAGCDWWRFSNSRAGECTRSAPVDGRERYQMLGFERSSLEPAAGHVMTLRDHVCGDFVDTHEWPERNRPNWRPA